MPELSEKTKTIYIKAYGHKEYDAWTDKPGLVHGVAAKITGTNECYKRCEEYDVESLFWVFISTLILASPICEYVEDKCAATIAKLAEALTCFESAQCNGYDGDTRDVLLQWTEQDWREALPKALDPVIPLVIALARQISPSYALLAKQPVTGHLHEAFRRLILDFIAEMVDPIILRPGVARSVLSCDMFGTVQATIKATVPAIQRGTLPSRPRAAAANSKLKPLLKCF